MLPIHFASVDKSSFRLQDLSALTVKQLRQLSTDSGIKIKSKAKKQDIIQSLLDYQSNGACPTSLPTSQLLRRPHKGPRTTPRSTKRETLSMRRVRHAMGMAGSNEMPSGLRVNFMSPLDWSKNMILKAEGRISDCPNPIASAGSEETRNSHLTVSMATHVEDRYGTEIVQGPTAAREASVAVVGVALTSPTGAGYQCLVPTPELSSTALLENPITPSKDDIYSISLAGGVQLHYDEADLHEPRSLTGLISNPDALHSIWCDTSSAWMRESPLVIRQVPVAMKYWKEFYSNFKQQKVWDSIKQTWHTIRILMHEYEEETKDGFRSKWSRNGNLLSSHQIIATLRSSNRNRDGELVAAAKQNFSPQEFDKIFSYRSKGGNVRIMTSPSAIAKRYRKFN